MATTDYCLLPKFVAGDVLALLTPLQELEEGLYLLQNVVEGWAVVRWVIDAEETERLLVTEREFTLPVRLLHLFMSVGVRLPLSSYQNGSNRHLTKNADFQA